MSAKIQVLLSTYNGAAHLDALLASIAGQTFKHWALLVRDDGSSDGTCEVLSRWQQRIPERLKILPDSGKNNIGVVRSFSTLLSASTAPYVMFADQDDSWYPNKIELTLAAMHRQESVSSADRPVLVHTDLAVMDQNLRAVADSYWKYQGLVPENGHHLSTMLVENIAAGCTCLMNRSLVDLVGQIPDGARYHDWWVSLVVAAFGDIVSIPIATIAWRRHGSNSSDIIKLSLAIRRAITKAPVAARVLANLLEENRPQARLFLSCFRDRLSPQQVAAIEAFLDLPNRSFVGRRKAALQHRLFFTSWQRTAGMLLLM